MRERDCNRLRKKLTEVGKKFVHIQELLDKEMDKKKNNELLSNAEKTRKELKNVEEYNDRLIRRLEDITKENETLKSRLFGEPKKKKKGK